LLQVRDFGSMNDRSDQSRRIDALATFAMSASLRSRQKFRSTTKRRFVPIAS